MSDPAAPVEPRSRPVIWNQLAHRRGELLSDQHAPDVLAERWARRYDGELGAINRWADHVRATTYEDVPYVDPASATDGARVLVLLQDAPGGTETGSGFVSRHNNDPVSANIYRAADRADLDLAICLHWTVVPWSVTNTARPPRSLLREAVRAAPYLAELVDMLDPAPSEVILLGRPAAQAWSRLARAGLPPALHDATVSRCPHPSPLVYTRHHAATGRGNSDLIVRAMRLAGQRARGEKVGVRRRRPF